MSILTIVHPKGEGSTEVVESGAHLALQPGGKVVIDANANEMTSSLKAESSLIFTVRNNLNYTIDNFFSDENNQIVFRDLTFSANELAKQLIISLRVTHADGVVRELWTAPFSTIPTHAGDKFEFSNSEVTFNDVHRKGNDLFVNFGAESAAAGKYINLSKFFGHIHSGVADPLLMLTDKEHKATDIIVHSEHNEQLQWHGVPITSATPGVPYGYYFYLTGDNLESVEVDLESLEGALPAWLTLVPLGMGEFILSGTPPKDFSGQLKLEIRAHETRNGVRLHTQQSFELTAIGAARRSTERAVATSVIAAELRGGGTSSTATQSILTGADSLAGMMSSSAMVIASASALSTTIALESRAVMVSTFEGLSVRPFGISQLDIVRTPVQAPVTVTTSSEKGGINVGASAATVLVLQEIQGRTAAPTTETIATPLSASVVSFLPPSVGPTMELLSTLSRVQLAGEFKADADLYTVAQTVNTFLPPQGVLINDADTILSGQFMQVIRVNGVKVPPGGHVVVTLPGGGTVDMHSDGSFTFDPTGMFIPLYQTNIDPVIFTYTATNGLVTSSSVVTLNVLGINDIPVITPDQVFSVPQYSAVGVPILAGTLLATEPDTGDILTYSITGGTGLGVFAIDPATGLISVINPFALTINPPVYTLTVQVEDSHPGVFGYLPFIVSDTITINITHVTPQITNSQLSFHINENSIAGATVGHVSATNYIVDDVVINPDVGDFLYTITGAQFSIDVNGNITVSNGATLPFNFQTTPSVLVNVTVTDDYYNGIIANPNLTTSAPFTIFVDGIAITNAGTFNVNMDSIPGTEVTQVSYVTSDPNPVPNFSIIGGSGSGLFDIDPVTGIITVANGATFDFRTQQTYTLNVHVSDNYSEVSTPLTDTATYTINITGVVISNTVTDFNVLDHSGPNTFVGDVNVVSNPSSTLGISYSITGGNAAGDFTISSSTGIIRVAPGHTLDYESDPTYSLTVTVVDANPALPTPMITSQVFTVNVQGIDILDPHIFSVDHGSTGGTFVGQVLVSSSDPNYATNTVYTIVGGNGASLFDINPSTGQITVEPGKTIDYSDRPSHSYTLSIQVVDTYGSFVVNDTESFTINVNPPPPVPLMALNGENTTNPVTTALSASTLSILSAVAIQNWSMTDLTPAQADTLSHLVFTVGDLPSGMLGGQFDNHIVIDSNAAGYGWYIDGQPLNASAFSINLIDGHAWQATSESGAYGHMDLMTVIMHEIGHALGESDAPYDANHPQLMADQLATGTRIIPEGIIMDEHEDLGNHSNQVLNFDNVEHAVQNDTTNNHDLGSIKGAEIFTDLNALNLKAINSVFPHPAEVSAQVVNYPVDNGPAHAINNDVWFINGVDASHTHYTYASGSIVGMEHHVPVLF